MKAVSAAEANRQFSSMLREVAQGETFTVLSRGKPVATITRAHPANGQRNIAKSSLIARLRSQSASGDRGWTRDELYDR
jgi:prevent-host-death family protein